MSPRSSPLSATPPNNTSRLPPATTVKLCPCRGAGAVPAGWWRSQVPCPAESWAMSTEYRALLSPRRPAGAPPNIRTRGWPPRGTTDAEWPLRPRGASREDSFLCGLAASASRTRVGERGKVREVFQSGQGGKRSRRKHSVHLWCAWSDGDRRMLKTHIRQAVTRVCVSSRSGTCCYLQL